MEETRKSTARSSSTRESRPSWGRRFSAMSISARALIRLETLLRRLPSSWCTSRRRPSTRPRTTPPAACGEKWRSVARSWTAQRRSASRRSVGSAGKAGTATAPYRPSLSLRRSEPGGSGFRFQTGQGLFFLLLDRDHQIEADQLPHLLDVRRGSEHHQCAALLVLEELVDRRAAAQPGAVDVVDRLEVERDSLDPPRNDLLQQLPKLS